jgi:response regulator RpfG family c-di-GMP phosphodiesterase
MSARPRILCLDDEPFVLDGLQRTLRSSYRVLTTTEPAEALQLLAAPDEPISVIVSDMRMPQMSGVTVLERAQQISPDTTRILLTGDADIHGAVAAINRGNVFRFVLKPCPPDPLKAAIAAAAEQYRLMRAEKELLQDTLKGCIDALMETLGMAQPTLFSRAGRLRRLVQDVSKLLTVNDAWQIEMAAQLGEIGAITLPPSAVEALQGGTPAGPAEAKMLASLPRMADVVLARIPRMEPVRDIIRHQLPTERNPFLPMADTAPEGARLLQTVREYDALVFRGMAADLSLARLTSRKTHDPEVIDALARGAGMRLPTGAVREVTIEQLTVGHELADDLYTAKGLLLVSRGQCITEQLLMRVRNFGMTTGVQGRILIVDGDGVF